MNFFVLYMMAQVNNRTEVTVAVQDSIYISSNVTQSPLLVFCFHKYILCSWYMFSQPTLWLYFHSWHNNHTDNFVHGIQRLVSGFAEAPTSLLLQTGPKQLDPQIASELTAGLKLNLSDCI